MGMTLWLSCPYYALEAVLMTNETNETKHM